jgi:hypothetical protein
LDAHGNPVTGEDDEVDYAGEASGRVVTEEEHIRLTSEAIQDEFGEVRSVPIDCKRRPMSLTSSSQLHSRSGESQVLFSAGDGDEDADELRSLRSSKFRWKPNSNNEEPSESAAGLEEASAIVARESMELERMWTGDHT